MNRQFPERVTKEVAVKNKENRKRTRAELFPQEAEQSSMQNLTESQPSGESASVEPPSKKKAPSCRKCHQPMRGHPRNQCPVPVTTQDNTSNNWFFLISNQSFCKQQQQIYWQISILLIKFDKVLVTTVPYYLGNVLLLLTEMQQNNLLQGCPLIPQPHSHGLPALPLCLSF